MKKLILLGLLGISLSAQMLYTKPSDTIVSKSSIMPDYNLVTFCRNNLQYIMVSGSQQTGLSLDFKLIDPNKPEKGVTAIKCNY